MSVERRLGLTLTHRRFNQQNSGPIQSNERVGHGLLQRARWKTKDLIERQRGLRQRQARQPTQGIKRGFRVVLATRLEPAQKIGTLFRRAEAKIGFVRANPVGEAGQPC